jgi:predicted esterase
MDSVVKYEFGKQTHEALKKMGVDAEFHSYEGMGHEANPTEIKLLGEWIKQRVGTDVTDDTTKATTTDAEKL